MAFDPQRRFVRLLKQRENGLVEFEFAVGEPDLAVELVMPRAAFDAFCAAQQVEFLAPLAPAGAAQGDALDASHWHLRDVTRDVTRDATRDAARAAAQATPFEAPRPRSA